MRWLCFHKFKWGKTFNVDMIGTYVKDGIVIGDPREFVETRQHGTCSKCGFVKERVLKGWTIR